jgi:hypothetical protein
MVKTPAEIQTQIDIVYVENETGDIDAVDAHETLTDIVDLVADTIHRGTKATAGAARFIVISMAISDPPLAPTERDSYVVFLGTGVWLGKNDQIATWDGGEWLFVVPVEGTEAYNQADNTEYIFDGADWIVAPVGITDHGALSGLGDDDHPQYLNEARGDARYDLLGQAASIMAAHLADLDPHPQYLTETEGDGLFVPAAAKVWVEEANVLVPNARIFTDSTSIVADYSTPGQVKLSVIGGGTAVTDYEESVVVASNLTDGNLVLSGLQTLNPGNPVTLTDGQRVLLNAQTLAKDNRVWLARSGAWDIAPGWDVGDTITSAKVVPIEEGDSAGLQAQLLTADPITLGTTGLTWFIGATTFISNFTTRNTTAATLTLGTAYAKNWIVAKRNGTQVFTLPKNSNQPHPIGTEMVVQMYGTGNKTVIGAATVTVNGVVAGSVVLTGRFDALWIKKIATNEWTIVKMVVGSSTGVSDGDWGDITVSGSGTVWTIDPGVVTLAKMADMATGSFLGRNTAGTGAPEVLSKATVKTMLDLAGSNTGDQLTFKTVRVATQTDVVATAAADVLTIVAGPNISIGTDAINRTITISTPAGTYSDEQAQDAIGAMIDSTFVYVDGTPLLSRAALTGDISAPAGSNVTTLATVNANVGSWGLAASVAQFTVNAKGLITAAANVAIAIASTAITDATAAGRAMLTAADAAAQTALLNVATTVLKGLMSAVDKAKLDAITGTNTGDQNLFSTLAVSGQSNVVADATSDTLTFVGGTGITITTDASTDTITFTGGATQNTFGTITISGQSDVVADSTSDTLTLVAGSGITLTTNAGTDTITISGSASQNTFATIAVSGQSDVVADSTSDTLTLVAGTGITITTNASTDTITITGSSTQNTFSTISVSGQSDVVADASADTLTLVAGTGIAITTNAGTDTITVTSTVGSTQGIHTLWIPATAMVADITNGPAAGAIQPTSHGVIFPTFDFDTSTQEYVQFQVRMLKSWNLSTVTFVPTWSHAATTTNFGVVWTMDAVACSDGDAGDASFGSGQTSTDTGGTTNTIYVGPASAAITIAGTPAAEDLVSFRVYRTPANGSDTMAIDARLHGVTLYFTTNADTDV